MAASLPSQHPPVSWCRRGDICKLEIHMSRLTLDGAWHCLGLRHQDTAINVGHYAVGEFTGAMSLICSAIFQLSGVICGLVYLHTSDLVHGDIRGVGSARASSHALVFISITGEHIHGRV
jgi:hypothetical protein